MTFSTLQTLSNPPVAEIDYDRFMPGDDSSVAKQIAERYEKQGIDPRAAYDNPDDAINDFGGPTAFI